ncbi:MAG: lamin tail domain-containing protein [Candidatus Thiodiazotropha sp.]|jgi:hypothetical protein
MLDIVKESGITSTVPQADAIVEMLKEQANTILSAVLGTTPLESFNVGSSGNMPYYWQDPRNLQFNERTYDWIKSALKAGITPIQQDQVFTNLYIKALSCVSYSLSSSDQEKLNQAKANATDQQMAVLKAWQDAFGSLPSGQGQPIDLIAAEIASQWAVPPTTLQAIQQSVNINQLLNNVPASGKAIVPVFANWLNAIGSAISLVNSTTMNSAYLAKALAAAQMPSDQNGGLMLDNNLVVPAYEVNTQLSDILNGLKNSAQAIGLNMKITRTNESEYQVNVEGGTGFAVPVFSLFSLNVGGNAHYFESDIATMENETSVKMTFPGVTHISFGPVPFDMSPPRNWFWMKPIQDAINNGSNDVSGFKFSPDPQIDFTKNGPFAYLMGAAISNYPSMEITVRSASYERIQQTFEQSASVGISFLGIPLGIGGRESSYSNKVTTNTSESTVTINLSPPVELVAGSAVDSVGWVLGVQPNYPAV